MLYKMQNLAHLPEKFSFKLDELGKRWIKENSGIDAYDNQGGFFNYPNYQDSKGFKKNFHLTFTRQMNGYTLITTEQLFTPQNNVPTIEKAQSQLNFNIMQNLQHLPEKFSFKLDELGKRWIRETFGSDYYDEHTEGFYFCYPNYQNHNGFKVGYHMVNIAEHGYTLITTDKLFPPQNNVPTIEKGVMMLVWAFEEELATEKEVIFFDGKHYYAKHQKKNEPLVSWQNAKPIPQLPEYTIEEAQEKFKFKVKCTSTE
jgi:hypothetical protein